jgi:hypothetical protein
MFQQKSNFFERGDFCFSETPKELRYLIDADEFFLCEDSSCHKGREFWEATDFCCFDVEFPQVVVRIKIKLAHLILEIVFEILTSEQIRLLD